MRVTWSDDGSAAYLIDENNRIVGRWFRDRPEMNTFDPATYTYGQGYGYQAPGQQQSWMYDAWQGGGNGDAGGYYQDPERLFWDQIMDEFRLTRAEAIALREENARQHDEEMQRLRWTTEQEMIIERERMAATTGDIRLQHQNRLAELEQQHQYAVEYLQLDWVERHKAADKELGVRLQEMWSGERLAAAQMGAQPINYRVYERWLAGLGGRADPSGLPASAPAFQTGPGMEGAVVPGEAPGPSPYAQAYATGQRIPEFQAYGGPTTPVGGEPWVSPHKTQLGPFLASPLQSQEMQYARWRERGFMPYTAEQQMRAAAPTGTAGQRVPSYG